MPAIPEHDTPVTTEHWDAQEQVDRIKVPIGKSVGSRMWAWYDASGPDPDNDGYPDEKADYKLPHHMVDGQGDPGDANLDACRNGLARLDDADIPDADKQGVRDHLQHHLDAQHQNDVGQHAQGDENTEKPAEAEPPAESVHAGFSEPPAQPSRTDLVLGRAWGIVPEVLAELSQRPIMADSEIEAKITQRPRQAQVGSASQPSTVAVIPLCGVITPHGSLLARLFGFSSGLDGFREDFRAALADDNISAIVIDVDSPGGLIDQVPETAAEIFGARGSKPIIAVCNTMCASAAYWIACQADELIATPSAQVGSIGVFTVSKDVSRLEQAMGIKTTIVSAGRFKTEGNPYEPLSKQAVAAMQSNVDDIYGMFTADIARARKTSVQAVQAGYGEGRVMLADRALALKMVDRVETLEQTLARLGATADSDLPEDDENLVPDDVDDDDIDLGASAAATSDAKSVVAADYLTREGLYKRPDWQLGASRSPKSSGRL